MFWCAHFGYLSPTTQKIEEQPTTWLTPKETVS